MSKKSTLEKMASKDAHNWARAEMFFGEGAGIRRRHLDAEINEKMATIPGYLEMFNQMYAKQDLAEHAIKAAQERKKIDAMTKAGKNMRAIKSGNLAGLSTGVYVVVGGAILARQTGYDKKIAAEVKKQYRKAKQEISYRRAKRNTETKLHTIIKEG